MAATDRAYTSEYSFFGQANEPEGTYVRSRANGASGAAAARNYTPRSAHAYAASYAYATDYAYPEPHPRNPRTRRTAEKVADKPILREAPRRAEAPLITHEVLLKTILLFIFAGAILIATIWLRAEATEIKYEINKFNKENVILQNEISMLDIKIESSNSIEQIEEYATEKLKMQYPKSQQCIYIEPDEKASDDLAQRIREKAYSE